MQKRLTRSFNKRLLGVCGGIAEYLNPQMDPVFIRIAWTILTIFNPLMVVLYFLLAIIMPEPDYRYHNGY